MSGFISIIVTPPQGWQTVFAKSDRRPNRPSASHGASQFLPRPKLRLHPKPRIRTEPRPGGNAPPPPKPNRADLQRSLSVSYVKFNDFPRALAILEALKTSGNASTLSTNQSSPTPRTRPKIQIHQRLTLALLPIPNPRPLAS